MNIKTNLEQLEKKVALLNDLIAKTYMEPVCGEFAWDPESKSIKHTLHGKETVLSPEDGLKKIIRTQNLLEFDSMIEASSQSLFESIIESEENNYFITDRFPFMYYKDFSTTIRAVSSNPDDWGHFDIEVRTFLIEGDMLVYRMRDVPASYRKIVAAVYDITIKLLELEELSTLLGDLKDLYKDRLAHLLGE